MGRGSPRPLPGPSHLSISGFALGSGFAPTSRALRAPIRALPSILGRFRPSIEASPSILGRNLGRFAPSVRALPSIYPLRNFDLVAPLGEGFGRKHGTDKWDWNGYYFHTGTCFFPIRALGIIICQLFSNPAQGCNHQSSCMPQLEPLCSAALVLNVLPRRDEGSDSLSPYRLHVT